MDGPIGLHELDEIVRDTIRAVERAREQIFSIAESARVEYDRVQVEAADLIRLVDSLERKEQLARRRLAEVRRDFAAFGEDEIASAYEQARHCGIERSDPSSNFTASLLA